MHNYDVCVAISRGRKEINRVFLPVNASSRLAAAEVAESLVNQNCSDDCYGLAVAIMEAEELELAA